MSKYGKNIEWFLEELALQEDDIEGKEFEIIGADENGNEGSE